MQIFFSSDNFFISISIPYPNTGEFTNIKVPSVICKFSNDFSTVICGLYLEYSNLFLYDTEKPCLASTKQGFSFSVVFNFSYCLQNILNMFFQNRF